MKELIEVMKYYKDFKNVKVNLEYDGEQITQIYDYITNLQEKYEEADNDRHKLFEQKEKAIAKLQSMFDNGNEETVLDDLLELYRVLGDDSNDS